MTGTELYSMGDEAVIATDWAGLPEANDEGEIFEGVLP